MEVFFKDVVQDKSLVNLQQVMDVRFLVGRAQKDIVEIVEKRQHFK